MIRINKSKNSTPLLLKDIKNSAESFENDLSPKAKAELRRVLLNDQGYICCYCQKRIPHKKIPKSKIEHFKSQENHPNLQLEFNNLFVACNGTGYNNNFTCDTKKSNVDIESFNLLTTDFDNRIKYSSLGTIISDDTSIDTEINLKLNLNDQNLIKSRLGVIEAIKNNKRKLNEKGIYNAGIRKLILEWESRQKGKFKEFKGVGLYFLKK